MKLGNQLILPILVIIVMAAGSIFYILNKNPNSKNQNTNTPKKQISISPTKTNENIQEHTSSDYGISFKYPTTWRLVETATKNKGGTIQLFNYPENKYIGGEIMQEGDIKIEIVILSNSKKLPLEDFVKTQTSQGLGASEKHIYEADILGNNKAISDRISNDSSYKSFYIAMPDDNVLVASTYPDSQNQDIISILSSIEIR